MQRLKYTHLNNEEFLSANYGLELNLVRHPCFISLAPVDRTNKLKILCEGAALRI